MEPGTVSEARSLAEVGIRLGALGGLVAVPEAGARRMEEWLIEVGRDVDPFRMTVTLAADERRLVHELSGSRAAVEAGLTRFASAAGVGAGKLAELEAACDRHAPEGLASWIEVTTGGMDLGWAIDGPVDLSGFWPLTAPSDGRDQLRDALADLGIDTAGRITRSLGAGGELAALAIAPPGDDVVAQVRAARDLIATLEVEPLPVRMLQGLISLAPGPAELRIWLAEGGVARAGIAVPDPSTELVLMLRNELGLTDLDAAALIEATLGVDRRESIEVVRGATGVSVELAYRLH